MSEAEQPLLAATGLTRYYGPRVGCVDVDLDIHEGEVLAVVGESGSGKSTLLAILSAQLTPTRGAITYRTREGTTRDLFSLSEAERRFLFRTDWGFVHQDPRQGLRMGVSAGGNVGERLMAVGWAALRQYSRGGRGLARPRRDRRRPH